MSLYWKALGGLTWASSKVGTPIVKGARWASGKTPKSVKKFGTKSKKYLSKEYKEMKYFAKLNPELFSKFVFITPGCKVNNVVFSLINPLYLSCRGK